jgi:uncharacterized protein YndB with AHSA1/START domain
MSLDHGLERSLVIAATRATVFRYFTDSERFAAWWGAGSTIEGRPGGAVVIRYPNGVTASGRVIEIQDPERIVFTYGYDDPSKPIPPGGSRVVITLVDERDGTRLHLRHEFDDPATRDQHVQGWRYQLAVFANVVAREQHARVAERVDRYFALWAEPDSRARIRGLAEIATEDVVFHDAFGCTSGIADLTDHLAAVQAHMPGVRLKRTGDVRQCQGTAVAEWVAEGPGSNTSGSGINVFDLAPDGRLTRVVGLWRS